MRKNSRREVATRKKLAELSDKVKKVDRDVVGGISGKERTINMTTADCDGAPGPC